MAAGPTYEPIATTTLSSTATSFTMSSIPSTYTDLKIVLSSLVSSTIQVQVTFNGDTATNYSHIYAKSNRTTATTARSINTTSMICGSVSSPGNTKPVLTTIDINNYADSTINKTLYFETAADAGAGFGNLIYGLGTWRSTSAITSITLEEGAANGFESGTTVTIYGIKAA